MNLQATTVVNMYFCDKCNSLERGCVKHQLIDDSIDTEDFWTRILGKTREEYFRENPNFGKHNNYFDTNLLRQSIIDQMKIPKPPSA